MGQHHSFFSSKNQLKWSGAPTFTCDDSLRCCALNNLTSDGKHEHLNAITAVLKKLTGYQMCIIMTIEESVGRVIAETGWPVGGSSQLPRPMSFFAWSLVPTHPEVLVVNDARKDARFWQNPVVKARSLTNFTQELLFWTWMLNADNAEQFLVSWLKHIPTQTWNEAVQKQIQNTKFVSNWQNIMKCLKPAYGVSHPHPVYWKQMLKTQLHLTNSIWKST